nr:SusC/RagA family TonB-linked outer membrane protein [Bacteroidales bacterium]
NTNYQRFNAQFNGESNLKTWLKIGHNLTLNCDIKRQGDYDIEGTLASLPNNPIYNEDGSWAGPTGNSMYVGEVINPIGRNELNTQKTVGYNILANGYAEIKPWDFLSLRSTAAVQALIWNQDNWTQAYDWEPVPTEESTRFQYHNNVLEWMWDNILTFDKTVSEKHHINAIAGLSITENTYKHFGGSVSSFTSDNARELSNGILDPLVYGSRSEWALLSVITRVNYNYDDRYYATLTWRLDGSSRFNKNNRWGNFPSVSLAWKINKELKVRAGYGMTGNQTNVGAYGYANTLSAVQYVFNDTQVGAFAPVVLSNPDITWEKVEQYNMGMDLDLLKGRINMSLDLYEKNTRDMLVPMTVPISSGYSDENVPQINAGNMRNIGTELSVTSRNISKTDFDWSTTVIASWNKGEITALNNDVPLYGGSLGLNQSTTINAVGHPAGSFYGYVTDGIFQTESEVKYAALQVEGGTAPGDIRFKDLNQDGVIDADDRTFLGNPTPSWQFSINNTVRWKNFELNFFLQGVADCEIYNVTRMNLEAMSIAENQSAMTLARWRGEGTSNSFPRAVYGDPNSNARVSDRFIEDGSYIRLKNVQIGWNMPSTLAEKLKINSFKVFLSGQNLLTLTRYSGMDPEVGASGLDNNIYPQTRTFTMGVNINF